MQPVYLRNPTVIVLYPLRLMQTTAYKIPRRYPKNGGGFGSSRPLTVKFYVNNQHSFYVKGFTVSRLFYGDNVKIFTVTAVIFYGKVGFALR
jgi:hypothetical protein